MIKRILIWALPVLALLGGTAGGSLLMPAEKASEKTGTEAGTTDAEATDDPAAAPKADADQGSDNGEAKTAAASHGNEGDHGGEGTGAAWFTFPNQFFVPVVRKGNIDSMMVLTLTIETTEAAKPVVEAQEHRLRDALLRSLMIHANSGGFAGNYTAEPRLERLRAALLAAAVSAAGKDVSAVLIEDLGQTGT